MNNTEKEFVKKECSRCLNRNNEKDLCNIRKTMNGDCRCENENKIEVGEYVRTYEGYIGKLVETNKRNYNYLTVDVQREVRRDGLYPLNYIYLKNENIVKHSKHIIDLIKAGEYVNGELVEKIENDYEDSDELVIITSYSCLYEKDIKSVVTKEQFSQIEYKVEKN